MKILPSGIFQSDILPPLKKKEMNLAGQSEQSRLYREGGLKETGAKTQDFQTEAEKRSCSNGQIINKRTTIKSNEN